MTLATRLEMALDMEPVMETPLETKMPMEQEQVGAMECATLAAMEPTTITTTPEETIMLLTKDSALYCDACEHGVYETMIRLQLEDRTAISAQELLERYCNEKERHWILRLQQQIYWPHPGKDLYGSYALSGNGNGAGTYVNHRLTFLNRSDTEMTDIPYERDSDLRNFNLFHHTTSVNVGLTHLTR